MPWMARRPGVAVAVAFMVGIAVHRFVPARIDLWLVTIALLTVGAIIMFRTAMLCSACVSGAIFVSGICAAQLEAFHFPADHVSAFATDMCRLAQLELYLEDSPRLLSGAFGDSRALPPKQALRASVRRLRTWSGWIDARGDVLVQIAQPHPRLAAGQTVRVLGMLERPAPAMNPGQFHWARYYREQRILVSVQIPHAENIRILSEGSAGILWSLRAHARRALARGFEAHQSLDHALLQALLLGDRDPELRDVQEQFRRTGTSHHLAISGMHIAVLGGVVYGVCRLLRTGPRGAVIIGTGFAALYGLTALPSPPVVRSVMLCVAFGLGMLLGKRGDALQLLALSVLVMLVWQPLDLFSAGFQLSFGTVLGLILLTRPMMQHLTTEADRDRWIAASAQPPDALTGASMWADRKVLEIFAAGVVAWLVSFPLVAIHFEQLNPWAVGASILMAPVVFLALVGGMLKIIFTLLWPSLAHAWATLAGTTVAWLRASVDLLSKLPGSDVPLPSPPLWLAALFYAALAAAMYTRHRPGMRWTMRLTTAGVGLTILALPYQRPSPPPADAEELRVTLLAVGAGQCAVVEPPARPVLLVDAGSSSLSDVLRKCLGPFLRHRARTSVDTLVLSHANYDHFSGASEVVGAYDVRSVLVGATFREDSTDNPSAEALLRALDQLDRPPQILLAGQQLPLGRDTHLQVLWPPKDTSLRANDASLVFRLSHAGRAILFTGDIQGAAMRELLKHADELKADVLIAPHHGSSELETPLFIAAVNPEYVLSSNDRTLTMKQRNLERMIGTAQLLRTHRCGAITVRIDRMGQISVEPFLVP